MALIDCLFSIKPLHKAIWRLWYPYVTRRSREEDLLFLNYAFEEDPPIGLDLDSDDEPNRPCIQLYHHVASQVNLEGREVLESSCGHGGGASWITRNLKPAKYTGLDLNPEGIKFCQERHEEVEGLSFVQGDAQNLPADDGSLDAVINVEASHCYPDFPAFLVEVNRVLRPGGHFLYADFRFRANYDRWEKAIANAPLEIVQSRDISAEVLRGMECNAERSKALVAKCLPRLLHGIGEDFAAVPGSRTYNLLKSGDMAYRSWCFHKAE